VDLEVVLDADFDFAAGHFDEDVSVAMAEFVGYGGGGTAAAAGGEGVAGSAFPDLDLDGVAVENFEELHVDALGEIGVVFDVGADAAGEVFGDFVEGNDAVGVADGGGVVGEGFAVRFDGFAQDFTGFADDWDLAALKTNLPHFDTDFARPIEDLGLYESAEGFDGEGGVLDLSGVPEIEGEDAEAVSTFFGFASVRVVDFETKLSFVGGQGAEQDAVGTESKVAVANEANFFFGKVAFELFGRQDEVVVA